MQTGQITDVEITGNSNNPISSIVGNSLRDVVLTDNIGSQSIITSSGGGALPPNVFGLGDLNPYHI